MADELTISVIARYLKGAISNKWEFTDETVDVASDLQVETTITVDNVVESRLTGGTGQPASGGWVVAQCLDATDFIMLYEGTGNVAGAVVYLKANDPPCVFRCSDGDDLYALAGAGPANLRIWIMEP